MSIRGKLYSSIGLIALGSFFWLPPVNDAQAQQEVENPQQTSWSQIGITIDQEFRYGEWEGKRGYAPDTAKARGEGRQSYTPLSLSFSGIYSNWLKVDAVGQVGWVHSEQLTANSAGSLSNVTDTVVSGTFTYLGWAGLQPFVTLNFNAPTGESLLEGTKAFAQMDQDFVSLSSFGEGQNFGTTVGVNLPLSNTLMLGLGIGYTLRGSYDRVASVALPSGGSGISRLSPGDVTTANVTFTYIQNPLVAQVTGNFSTETTTELNGRDYFDLGNRHFVTVYLGYTWNERTSTEVSAFWNYFQRNRALKSPDGDNQYFQLEDFNSNSHLYQVSIQQNFALGTWTISPYFSAMKRNQNAWNPITFEFVPDKVKLAGGLSLTKQITDSLSFKAKGELFRSHESASPTKVLLNPFPGLGVVADSGIPELTHNGWSVMIGLSLKQ